jgi:hypothetical protein
MREHTELLPCPFCGGEAFLYGLEGEIVKCDSCEAETPERYWNRRIDRWANYSNEELEIFDYYLDIEAENSPSAARLKMVDQIQAEQLARRKAAQKEGA